TTTTGPSKSSCPDAGTSSTVSSARSTRSRPGASTAGARSWATASNTTAAPSAASAAPRRPASRARCTGWTEAALFLSAGDAAIASARKERPDALRHRRQRELHLDRHLLRGPRLGKTGRPDPRLAALRTILGKAARSPPRRGLPGHHVRPAGFRRLEQAHV